MKLIMIAAMDRGRIIGKDNKLPWRMPADVKHFSEKTAGYPVIMGRKTYESIPEKFRPLKGRKNIIVTKQVDFQAKNCFVAHTLEDAIEIAAQENPDKVHVIGGESIYKAAMSVADELDLTFIDGDFLGDSFFPEFRKEEWREVSREENQKDESNPFDYSFVMFERTR